MKYEPFSAGKRGGFAQWLADLPCGDDDDLRQRFAALCAGCAHDVEYPPFVRKPTRPQSRVLLRLSWQLGKAVPFTRRVYEWYGRPRLAPNDWVLIKQVNFPNERLDRLAHVLQPAVIAVLRNPYASIASAFRYRANPSEPFKTAATIARVLELLPSVAESGVPQYHRTDLEAMSDTEFEAVRWRVQSEPLAAFADRYPRAMVLTHDEFAADPERCARLAYGFLGWEFDESVAAYVRETTAGEWHRRGSTAQQKLHGIHRDPVVATQRWRKDLTDDQVAEIRRVVDGSALLDRWPELGDRHEYTSTTAPARD